MIGEEYFTALIQQVNTEHRALHRRINEVQKLLLIPHEAKIAPPATMELRAALADLRECIAGHFCQEECGGCLEEVVVRMPRLAHELTILEKQHGPLMEHLTRIIDEMPPGETTIAAWQHTATEFERFARDLLIHEADEEKILQQGLNEELNP